MKRYLVVPIAIMVIFGLILSGCGNSSTPTTANPQTTTAAPVVNTPLAPITFKVNYTMPKGAGMGAAFDWWGAEFEKRTNGRYKVEIYPSGTLLAPPATLDGVKKGVAQMSLFVLGINPGFPLTMVTGLPSFGCKTDNVQTTLAACQAWWEFYNLPEIQQEWKDIQLVWPAELDSNILISKKELRVPADFKGLKIGGSGYVMEIVNSNGGATVTQMPPDMYMNLDKGVVNGSVTGLAMIHDYKIPEIIDYYLDVDLGSGVFPTIINKEFYAAMSAEDKKIFDESIQEFAQKAAEFSVQARLNGLKDIETAGKKLSPLTATEKAEWDKASAVALQKWKDDCVKSGVDISVAERVYASWETIFNKYLK